MTEFDILVSDIDKEIRNEPSGHSEFQICNFIIGSQPTIYGKYKQCVLELRSRIKNYKSIMSGYNKLKAKEKLSTNDIKQMSEYEICLEDIKRETYIISDLYKKIKKNIDLNNRDNLEVEYWDEKFGQEVAAHRISGYPLPVGLVQNILALPNTCRTKQLLIEQIVNLKEIDNGSARSITDKSK